MTPQQAAQKLVDFKTDAAVIARVQELVDKCDTGTLSAEEFDEYRSLADAGVLISLLKAKPRRLLKDQDS